MSAAPRLTLIQPAQPEKCLSAKGVCDLLGIARSTFYTLPYFRQHKVKLSRGRVGWRPSIVARYIQLQEENANGNTV